MAPQPQYVILGRDEAGNLIPIGITDSGKVGPNGEHIFLLAVDATSGGAADNVNIATIAGVAPSTPGKIDVIGAVTANAGTNLNTSALALESGGHLANVDTTLTEIGTDTDAIETNTGNIPAKGQAAMVASTPVAIASDQSPYGVELVDAAGTNKAKIDAAANITEAGENVAVHDPTIGISTAAGVTTDAAGTIQQYLRGLIAKFLPAVNADSQLSVSVDASALPAVATLQNALSGNANGTVLTPNGYATLILTIDDHVVAMSGGTTVFFEVSNDNFANDITAIAGLQIGTNTIAVSTTSTSAGKDWRFNIAGYRYFRARIGAYSAGTITITATTIIGTGPEIVIGATLLTLIAGENLATNRLNVEPIYSYTNITTDTTTVIKSGAGTLHSITINTPIASSVITIYDNTSAANPKIATITLPAVLLQQGPYTAILDISFATGLTIVTATGASDITVAWR